MYYLILVKYPVVYTLQITRYPTICIVNILDVDMYRVPDKGFIVTEDESLPDIKRALDALVHQYNPNFSTLKITKQIYDHLRKIPKLCTISDEEI